MYRKVRRKSAQIAVIFDMDGVLIDSIALNWKAINQALAPYEVKVNDVDISQYLGKTLKDQAEQLNDGFHINLNYIEFASEVSRARNTLLDNLKPKPGVVKLLKELEGARIPFTVATSTSRLLAEQYLSNTGLLAYFDTDTIFTAEEVSRHKPDPEVYAKAAEMLGASPVTCVVFEDAPAGVRAAKAAGMSCVALSTAYVSNSDLEAADLIIPSMEVADLSIIQSVAMRKVAKYKE